MSFHEPFKGYRSISQGSNRHLGIAFGAFFALIALWPFLHHREPRYWALLPALAFLGLAAFAPQRLAPLNRLWFKLGLAMHSVMSPFIMGLLFYCAVTPMGLLLRLFNKDLLRLKRSNEPSYWITREPRGPAAGSMRNQF